MPKAARRNVINNAVRLDSEGRLPLAKVKCFRYLGSSFRKKPSYRECFRIVDVFTSFKNKQIWTNSNAGQD